MENEKNFAGAVLDGMRDWREQQKKKAPGEPSIVFDPAKIGIFKHDTRKMCVVRMDDLIEIIETNLL